MRLQPLLAAALLSVVDAQGFFASLTAELGACGSDNFIGLGCFPNFLLNADLFFRFSPQGFNPSDPSLSFPRFDPGSPFNNTVTPRMWSLGGLWPLSVVSRAI